MSQSMTELEQLRAQCKSLEESESQAQAELEQVHAKLETSWDLESVAQRWCKKAQEELEGILLNPTYPLALFFFPSDSSLLFSGPGGISQAVQIF